MKIEKKINKKLVEDLTEIPSGNPGPDGKPEATKVTIERIKNTLTDRLDLALSGARLNKKLDENVNNNVLVIGLPGSSKTASIKNWAKDNNVNLYALNAKNPDLELAVNGGVAIDNHDPKDLKIVSVPSDIAKALSKPNTVVFLDEFNRQTNTSIRSALLTFLEEKKVAGSTESGQQDFSDTILFTIAAINPPSVVDSSATKLTGAEMRRFQHIVEFDSDIATAVEYVKKHYDKKIKELYIKYSNDLDNKDYLEALEMFLRMQDIGLTLLTSPKFAFTTNKADVYGGTSDYERAFMEGRKILCQAAITELVGLSFGDIDKMKTILKGFGFLDKDKDTIESILNGYRPKKFEQLVREKELSLGVSLTNKKQSQVLNTNQSNNTNNDHVDDGNEEGEDGFTTRKRKVAPGHKRIGVLRNSSFDDSFND